MLIIFDVFPFEGIAPTAAVSQQTVRILVPWPDLLTDCLLCELQRRDPFQFPNLTIDVEF